MGNNITIDSDSGDHRESFSCPCPYEINDWETGEKLIDEAQKARDVDCAIMIGDRVSMLINDKFLRKDKKDEEDK